MTSDLIGKSVKSDQRIGMDDLRRPAGGEVREWSERCAIYRIFYLPMRTLKKENLCRVVDVVSWCIRTARDRSNEFRPSLTLVASDRKWCSRVWRTYFHDVSALFEVTQVDSHHFQTWRSKTGSGFPRRFPVWRTCFPGGMRMFKGGPVYFGRLTRDWDRMKTTPGLLTSRWKTLPIVTPVLPRYCDYLRLTELGSLQCVSKMTVENQSSSLLHMFCPPSWLC